MGAGKVEFLLNNVVVSTMDVQIKAGMNRFQWPMRGPAPAARNRRSGGAPALPGTRRPRDSTGQELRRAGAGGRGGGRGGA